MKYFLNLFKPKYKTIKFECQYRSWRGNIQYKILLLCDKLNIDASKILFKITENTITIKFPLEVDDKDINLIKKSILCDFHNDGVMLKK